MSKLISFAGWLIMGLWNRTLRVTNVNADFNGKAVFAFWHGEQFVPFFQQRNKKIVIMSSLSKDGEIQAGILKHFGYAPVRGSSSKRGERALVETIREVKKGSSAAFAVDGPKGPLHKVKPGIVYLAQRSKTPVIPAGTASRHFFTFAKAWDKYELPLPLSRAVVAYGAPLVIAEDDDIDEKTKLLERALLELSEFSHKYYWSKNLEEYLSHHPRPRILIVQPSRIGDVVFSLPTLHSIRKRFPKAWIGWFVDERCAPLIEGNRDLDEIIVFDRNRKSPGDLYRLYKYLHSKRIDLSIDLHGLFKSAFMVFLAGARYRIGSSSTRGMNEFSGFFSKEIKPDGENLHCVERHLAVAKFLGGEASTAVFDFPDDEISKTNVERILKDEGIEGKNPLVVIHAGAGWIARRWFPERFAELAKKLKEAKRADVVLIGGKEGGAKETGLNQKIIELSHGSVTDLTGRLSLRELTALLKKAALFIANEAGPMHIGVALGRPVISILGPTDPSRTGPYRGAVTIRHEVECQPCRKRNCRERKCMDLITVDDVFVAAERILKERTVLPVNS
jgi:heptosyltransferase I